MGNHYPTVCAFEPEDPLNGVGGNGSPWYIIHGINAYYANLRKVAEDTRFGFSTRTSFLSSEFN